MTCQVDDVCANVLSPAAMLDLTSSLKTTHQATSVLLAHRVQTLGELATVVAQAFACCRVLSVAIVAHPMPLQLVSMTISFVAECEASTTWHRLQLPCLLQ